MTLGPSSLLSLAVIFSLGGCAFGEVTGTGDATRGSDRSTVPTDSNQGTSSGSTATEPAGEQNAGPTDYDALFDAPADPSTTDDLVTGLWAGTTSSGEVRLKLTATKVVIAIKCGDSPATGMEVGAVITSSKLKILASKSVSGGSGYCGIKVTPLEIPRCTGTNYDCFEVSGTKLEFGSTTLFTSNGSSYQSSYTKLSD
jgi:hypothetical protein